MRFLVDECTGPAVAHWLRAQNHEVFSVYEEARGMEDDEVIAKAFAGNWILIVITYQLPTNHPYFVIASRRRRRSNPHIGQEIASLRSQ